MTIQTAQVKFIENEKGSPVGKLADVELHFVGGLFDGLKLIGFALWERRGGGLNVTFPARQYSVNGERRSFALLRPVIDQEAQTRVRDYILQAWEDAQKVRADASEDESLASAAEGEAARHPRERW